MMTLCWGSLRPPRCAACCDCGASVGGAGDRGGSVACCRPPRRGSPQLQSPPLLVGSQAIRSSLFARITPTTSLLLMLLLLPPPDPRIPPLPACLPTTPACLRLQSTGFNAAFVSSRDGGASSGEAGEGRVTPLLDYDPYKEGSRRYFRTVFDFQRWAAHRSTRRYVRHLLGMPKVPLLYLCRCVPLCVPLCACMQSLVRCQTS